MRYLVALFLLMVPKMVQAASAEESPHAQQEASSLNCFDSTKSDAGYSITIKKSGAFYEYSFSEKSYQATKDSIAKNLIQISTANVIGTNCELTITNTKNANVMFTVQFTNGHESGKMISRKGVHVPNLSCTMEPELYRRYCSKQTAAVTSDGTPGASAGLVEGKRP